MRKEILANLVGKIITVNTEAKLRFAINCENMTKKQLYEMKKEKVEITLELAKARYV